MSNLSFHTQISFLKSGMRIVGLVMLILNLFLGGLIMILLAEILGILEEFQSL